MVFIEEKSDGYFVSITENDIRNADAPVGVSILNGIGEIGFKHSIIIDMNGVDKDLAKVKVEYDSVTSWGTYPTTQWRLWKSSLYVASYSS